LSKLIDRDLYQASSLHSAMLEGCLLTTQISWKRYDCHRW